MGIKSIKAIDNFLKMSRRRGVGGLANAAQSIGHLFHHFRDTVDIAAFFLRKYGKKFPKEIAAWKAAEKEADALRKKGKYRKAMKTSSAAAAAFWAKVNADNKSQSAAKSKKGKK